MTAEEQILRELKLLREDVAKLKQAQFKQEKDKEVWVTANILKKQFGADHKQLYHLRRSEAIKFKTIRPNVVRYLLSSAEQFFKQKQAS